MSGRSGTIRKAKVVLSPTNNLREREREKESERERATRPNRPKQLRQVMLELRIAAFTAMKLVITSAIAQNAKM